MKLRIWHFVTPTDTEWQQGKPADDNGTAEYFLDGCVAAHRTANNGWQTSPTRTPQRIWFLENVAGGPPEDVDGAWVRCYFDPQSGRWVALGNLNGASQNQNPEDPANNNDCCEFGQLFICPLPEGIDYEVLCSAIDPPIDGEKMHKICFFAVDANGDRIESGGEILEHKELLTLPCTEEVCKNVDLSSVELDGVSIGTVTYGNHSGCCVIPCDSNGLIFASGVTEEGFGITGITNNIVEGDGLTMVGAANFTEVGTSNRWFVGPGQDIRFSLTLSDITIEDPTTQNFPNLGISGSLNSSESIQLRVEPVNANDARQPENVKFPYVRRLDDGSFQDLGLEWTPGDHISIRMNSESLSIEINGVEVATQEVLSQNSCHSARFLIVAQNRFSSFSADPFIYTGPGTVVFTGISTEVSNTPS